MALRTNNPSAIAAWSSERMLVSTPTGRWTVGEKRHVLVESDRSRISLGKGYEIDFWTRQLGVSERELRYALGAVGDSPEAVQHFLRHRY